jgi:superfamily II DNA or RNA helicase
MLFYTQIRREFPLAVWKLGQVAFREERVRDVTKSGNIVSGRVNGPGGEEFTTRLAAMRGTIARAECTCGTVAPGTKFCEHVAALSIWTVERGSLLRSGVASGGGLGMGFRAEEPRVTPEPSHAIAVTFVRGVFHGKVLMGVSVEPALRFQEEGVPVVTPLRKLVRQVEPRTWRTAAGLYLKATGEEIPVLGTLDSPAIFHQGQAAVDQLARLLALRPNDRLLFHSSVELEVDPEPLKLVALKIGERVKKTRVLIYSFENSRLKIDSHALGELERVGRLSCFHLWKDQTLYRFEPSLAQLARFANRSGVAALESEGGSPAADGFGYLYDDAEYPLHPLSAYRLSLEVGVPSFAVDPSWVEFHEWRKVFERKRVPQLPNVPYGFDLRDYQRNGLSWLWSLFHRRLAALLADDMGLGKTHQLLAFLSSVYRGPGSPKEPSLVIAPTSVIAAWIQKLERYDTGLRWHVYHGSGRVRPDAKVQLVLTTYGILHRDPSLREKHWHTVVLDEAQMIKNASTLSSRASRTLKTHFRVAMTGTPVENHATDLWSILEFLLPGYLGSLPRFKRLYGARSETPPPEQAEMLKRLVSPFLLRRTKSQVLKELPEKTEEIVKCEMTTVQRSAYRAALMSHEAAKIRSDIAAGGRIDYANILALLTRLKQICDHPRLPDLTSGRIKSLKQIKVEDTGKWEAFAEILTEALGSGLKIVVFTQYLTMMDIVTRHLTGLGVGWTELRGDTTDRAERLEKFATDPEVKVFVCSLLAGGLGIDLTSASVCIHLDRWWNPAKENQATDRLHRIGQTRGVQVFKLQIPGSVEDRIADIIESKKELSALLIQESSLGLKAFSRSELLDLLAVPT